HPQRGVDLGHSKCAEGQQREAAKHDGGDASAVAQPSHRNGGEHRKYGAGRDHHADGRLVAAEGQHPVGDHRPGEKGRGVHDRVAQQQNHQSRTAVAWVVWISNRRHGGNCMGQVPSIDLTTDVAIPQLGFGVFQVPPAETKAAVAKALQVGYRSIDTAAVYGNARQVGEAIAESGVPRQELVGTTELWNSEQGYDSTRAAFDASMPKLGLEQLDLCLVHWRVPKRDRYLDTWGAFERLHADGRVRAIG